MPFEVTASATFHMGPNTFMWIQVLSFEIDVSPSDSELLVALIASAGYAHSYASPFDPGADVVEPAIHGKYWRSSISAERFEPTTAAEARTVLLDWAEKQDWADPHFVQPPEALARLTEVCELFKVGTTYRLVTPGREHWHDWGDVVGHGGFHEFVVIDRSRTELKLIVASDD